ncbi:MAG: cytochrome P460 family protein [Candidatus Loosdrechtia sp.]|uniref:cytochrome P460 family protein n=1 Tax=Candidatus Loosdrechtia sp. TaxID=3101272 RepID=UPI003A756000|nr:MAG: cytochrome P460 family protein [Candidatus Jettenia sp. AMX2]
MISYLLTYRTVTALCMFCALLIPYGGKVSGEMFGNKDSVNAQLLWRYITEENPYRDNYPQWPGKEGFYESTMPPGNILKLYINDIAFDTVVNKRGVFPDGALLIKENYTDNKELFLITVMYKAKGFNPAGHDWYWIKYKPDGEARLEGKVDICINCHIGVAGNDYIFTGNIKE